MARLVWVHVGSLTHWADLMFTKCKQKTTLKDIIPNTDKYLKETDLFFQENFVIMTQGVKVSVFLSQIPKQLDFSPSL